MKWLVGLASGALVAMGVSWFFLHMPSLTFAASAVSLIVLSIILGEATEQLSMRVGERTAGLLNVTLSNLAELIIVFAAVRANLIGLVQAGIVGSIIGNLLLVMGAAICVGCRRHGTMQFNRNTASLYINQFYLVAVVLLLPSLFDAQIPDPRKPLFSYLLAFILVGTYVYFYYLSMTDTRFHTVKQQAKQVEAHWSTRACVLVLVASAVAAFFASECLVHEVDPVAAGLGCSEAMIGFIILPLLGNISEHVVAVTAARKGMTELSLAISVGSATQVGMVVAPCAVLFGVITGNAVTLNFSALPLCLLGISLVGAFLVLRDDEWNVNEGVTLIALYAAIAFAFLFMVPGHG